MENSKSILLSKTFWYNLFVGILSVVVYINPELLQAIGLSPEAQNKVLVAVGTIVAVSNVILRAISNTPVNIPGITKKVPLLLVCFMLGVSSCNLPKLVGNVQTYMDKHCDTLQVANPINGDVEVQYDCANLYDSQKIKDKCPTAEFCFDIANAHATGKISCPGVVKVPKLQSVLKPKK